MNTSLKQIFNSSMGIVLITATVYGLFLGFILIQNNFDFSRFILLSPNFADINKIPHNISLVTECLGKKRTGFDGQFYYRLSLNPFTNKTTDYGIKIDSPQLRQQRILYPILVRILSFGINSLIPIIMILVNFFMLCLMAWFSGEAMRYMKINIYWGLLIPFYPGFIISLSRDLTEILGICLLTIAFWSFLKNKIILSAVFASLAVLARETTLVFAIGFLIFYFYEFIFKNKKSGIKNALIFLIPLATFIIWQIFLFFNWHKTGIGEGISSDIGFPFLGLISNILNKNLFNLRNGIEIFYLLAMVVITFLAVKSSQIKTQIKVCWIVAFLIFSFTSAKVWTAEFDFIRAFTEPYFFGILIILTSAYVSQFFKKTIFAATIMFWLAFVCSAFLIARLCIFI